MKTLIVPCIQKQDSIEDLMQTIERKTNQQGINTINWKEYPSGPDVNFHIAHDGGSFLLKFIIKNEAVSAVRTRINEDVYKDSCCEFFFTIDNRAHFNLEVNAIGTCLLGYGIGRKRKRLAEDKIRKIETFSSLGKNPIYYSGSKINWELAIRVPFEVFDIDSQYQIMGKTFKGNFHKCGDETPEVHYLTWNQISSPIPNFHNPNYFGSIIIVN